MESYANEWTSSKGNQLKWREGNTWYKADSLGYEGLSEYVVSHLLTFSSLKPGDLVLYDTCNINYKKAVFKGCSCEHFLKDGESLITLERLFKDAYNRSFYESVYLIAEHEQRAQFIVDSVIRLTGIADFGAYLSILMTIDALFLNEDRHLHNIAVIRSADGSFRPGPVFDSGASLLSDTTADYPMGSDIYECIADSKPKTFCDDHDEQLDIAERLYGRHIRFFFTKQDIVSILRDDKIYGSDVKERVLDVLLERMRKYRYMFREK